LTEVISFATAADAVKRGEGAGNVATAVAGKAAATAFNGTWGAMTALAPDLPDASTDRKETANAIGLHCIDISQRTHDPEQLLIMMPAARAS